VAGRSVRSARTDAERCVCRHIFLGTSRMRRRCGPLAHRLSRASAGGCISRSWRSAHAANAQCARP
jgi:hypothetical protein